MRRDDSRAFEIVALLLYSTLIVVSACFHEPFCDEAQAWLIARDLPLPGIIHQMGYEGSPALWHLILMPFAKLGVPFAAEEVIHVLIAILMIAVFLFFSPFSRLTKILVAFSYYMTFEYAIIARNYNLSVLLLFLAAALYAKRFTRPILYSLLILLLFNTNVHSFGIAGGLVLLYLLEALRRGLDSETVFAIGLMVLGAGLSILQIKPHPDQIITLSKIYFSPLIVPIAIKHIFFPMVGSTLVVSLLQTLGSAIILLSVFFYLMRKPPVVFLLVLSYLWLFSIFVFKHFGGLRHHGLLFVAALFCLWIAEFYADMDIPKPSFFRRVLERDWKRYSILLVNLSLVFSLYLAAEFHFHEITMEYSGGKRMAEYIKKNHLEDRIIAAHTSLTETLLPLLPGVRFWYAGIGDWGTFATWDKKFWDGHDLTPQDVVGKIEEKGFPKDRLLLLLTSPLENPEFYHYRLLFKVDENIFGTKGFLKEVYYLYVPVPEKTPGERSAAAGEK